MPRICYVPRNFKPSSLTVITNANRIIEEYLRQGYTLTLRQLYYQFVAADLIPNKKNEYAKFGSIISDARLAGLIDWSAIEDRGRNLVNRSHWGSPAEIIQAAVDSYAIDKWQDQDFRVEVWVEKESLIKIIDDACKPLDVSCFACKGYTSQSEMWRASNRFKEYESNGQTPVIIHLGDHDPSGLDMSRDLRDRLGMFEMPMEINRIALNMDQVEQYDPPPNPAKLTDSRCQGYIAQFGHESWELDALEPTVMRGLIQGAIKNYLNQKKFQAWVDLEKEHQQKLTDFADTFEEDEDDQDS